jgi:hypothetical protein
VVSHRWQRTVGFAVHAAAAAIGVWAVVAVTAGVSYPPLRRAMVVLAVVLALVSLLGRAPRVLGPVAEDAAARTVRAVGFVLAGLAVWGVVVEFWFNGDSTQVNPGVAERANTGVPFLTVLFGLYLAAVLAATRRASPLGGRTLTDSVAIVLAAVVLWAGVAVLVPPAGAAVALLVVVAAGIAAAVRANRRAGGPRTALLAGVLTAVITAQVMISVADVMFHLGPDAWIADAGPGPLTPQDRLDQSRVEAIDPYVAVLFLGGMAAVVLLMVAFVRWSPLSNDTPAELSEATVST